MLAGSEADARLVVLDAKGDESLESGDALSLVAAGDSGAKTAARFCRLRRVESGSGENRLSAEDTYSLLEAEDSRVDFGTRDAFANALGPGGARLLASTARRLRRDELRTLRHCPFRIEEEIRTVFDGAATVEMMKRRDARPVDEAINHVTRDGIGEDVADLLEHRVRGDEQGDAGRLARPKIFPAAPADIEGTREHRVQAREERGE